jgi:hypothetical protein
LYSGACVPWLISRLEGCCCFSINRNAPGNVPSATLGETPA